MATGKQAMSDEALADMVKAQIEIAIAAPQAWEVNKSALLMLPNGSEIVEMTIAGIRDRKRKVQVANVVKTAISEDSRPENFEEMVGTIVDSLIAISENVEVLKWENVGGRGTDKRFKQRVASIPVMNGVIAVQHKQEMRKTD